MTYSFIPVGKRRTERTVAHGENSTVATDDTFCTSWGTGCPRDHDFEFYATTAYGTPITATDC